MFVEEQMLTLGVVDEDLVQYFHVLGEGHHTLDVVLFPSLDYPVAVVVPSLLDLVAVVEVIFVHVEV